MDRLAKKERKERREEEGNRREEPACLAFLFLPSISWVISSAGKAYQY